MADKKLANGGIVIQGVAGGVLPKGLAVYLRRATWRDYIKLALRLRFRTMFKLWRKRGLSGMIYPAVATDSGKVVIGVAMGPDTILVGVDPGIEPSCDEVVDDG